VVGRPTHVRDWKSILESPKCVGPLAALRIALFIQTASIFEDKFARITNIIQSESILMARKAVRLVWVKTAEMKKTQRLAVYDVAARRSCDCSV
jgi:hypothetical protein